MNSLKEDFWAELAQFKAKSIFLASPIYLITESAIIQTPTHAESNLPNQCEQR